ncbi:unnamed protein product [Parnassius apollo]|uniref:(apollo) hypothetical protein n=1 Tax=Parnassius apollo TaxID=110799 RepID=A0A8S3XH98_PARAO|nr:unnamed protein product [Parnassius apollo]
MNKCDRCEKPIAKRTPGLECSKCEKFVHATQACTNLSTKQIAALRNADSLEWTCKDCQRFTPVRKSYIIPEEEEKVEQNEQTQDHSYSKPSIDIKKLLKDISKEVGVTIKRELEPIESSISYCHDKLDEVLDNVDVLKRRIIELETKNIALNNKNNNLEIRINVLEQKIGELEQKQYSNKIELTGISDIDNINHHQVTKILASKLDMDANSVKSIKQIEGRKGKDGYLLLELSDETESEKWIQAAKMKILKINDILPNAPMIYNEGKDRIMLRRALTKTNKIILWNAKKQLGSEYKYIWFKNGHIFARKRRQRQDHNH